MRNRGASYPHLLTLCLALTLIQPVSAQLAAAFSSDITRGCAPLVVRFRDESTGNPTSWKWDLGNGTISYFQNPAATFFNPGNYTVKLVVSNGTQTDSIIRVHHIIVYPLPVVNFTASDTAGCFPLKVRFNDFSAAGNGSIVKWLWDFGDGSTDTVQNPDHTYTTLGNFNVTLQATNSRGCVSTLTKTQYIKLTKGVKAGFTYNAPPNCRPPTPVTFTNISFGTGILSYLWDFGDGVTSTLQDPVHVYSSAGSYIVKLVVRNDNNCADSIISSQAITIGTVNALFTAPDTVCAGSYILFNNTSQPTPVSASWNFGDNTTSNVINPVKVYTAPGDYVIKLISNFGTCLDSMSKPVHVLARPTASFTATNTTACKPPLTTSFTSNVPGAVNYQWFFGDGNTGTGTQPSHTYSAAGNFDVTLVVTNAWGCTDTVRIPGQVQIRPPVVNITNLPLEGCVPLLYQPAVTVQSLDPIVSWSWDFGDGVTATGINPVHNYTNPGTYTVKVYYTTAGGCTDSVIMRDRVLAGIKLNAGFAANPRISCAFNPIQFSDLTTGGQADGWYWMFGDGTTSTAQHPGHIYQDTGLFHVTLIVTNNGCRDTLQMTNYVQIKPPIARFIDSSGCDTRFTRKFIDQSIGATSWYWNFGDGNTSTQQSPTHTYTAAGTYTVELVVKNDTCEHFTLRQIRIISEKADFTASDTVICKGSVVTFATKNINLSNIASYYWDFGDGIVLNGQHEATHIYTNTGTYSVQLIIRDIYGCADTLIKPLYIRVDGPSANFNIATPGTCLNTTVQFNDASSSDGTHPITKWIWNYGDGIIDTLTAPPFQHTYTNAGTYNIALTTIDSEGCADSISRSGAIVISRPQADFTSTDTITCENKQVRFSNLSTGPALSYKWDFGDGQTSALQDPVHTYTTEGNYIIRLSIRDQYGCVDTAEKADYIEISNPMAQFSMSDSVSSCPPLVVNFNNQSQHFISHEWDFGDGTQSSLQNPLHFYTYPGTYRAKLTVVSNGGCVDSFFRTIVVRGPQGIFSYDQTSGCLPTTIKFIAETKDQVSFIWDFNDGVTEFTNDSVITHTYTQMGEYLPKMILKDPQGCQVPIVGLDTIRIYGVNAAMGMDRQLMCDSGRVYFRDSSVSNDLITSYYWTFGDGATSALQHPSHVYQQAGNYPVSLTVTTQEGCKDTVYTLSPIRVVVSPQGTIRGDTAACVPAVLDLYGVQLLQDTSAVQWRWDFGNNTSSTLQDPLPVTYTQAGDYQVKLILTNSSGCEDTAYYPVWARPLPVIQTNNDLTICRFQSTPLQANGGIEYTWLPASGLSCTDCATPVATPDSTRKYTVQGKNIYGCVSSDSVLITVKQPFTLQAAAGDTICVGESFSLFASGAELYNWTPATGLNDPNSSNPRATPSATTLYRVVGRDSHNCFTDTGYVPITVYPYPLVDAGSDKTITVGSGVKLTPVISSDVRTVKWEPEKWLDCVNCPQPLASPKQNTKYTISVTNEGGCVTTDDLTIFVICVEGNLFLPNTFSPNGDGMNDVFYPRGKGIYGIKSFRVFNRWGEMIFERGNIQANDIGKGWDGTYKGKLASQDVYVYTIDIVCENNQIFSFKGNVALIR